VSGKQREFFAWEKCVDRGFVSRPMTGQPVQKMVAIDEACADAKRDAADWRIVPALTCLTIISKPRVDRQTRHINLRGQAK
jgi:hypothetical protein